MTELSQWDWVSLGDREGRVDHPSAAPTWLVPPKVELEGEWLVFRRPVRHAPHGPRVLERLRVSADTSLLTKFVQLDEAPAERILAYARQHGPFGFCEHGDLTHRLDPSACWPASSAAAAGRTVGREALSWWRNLAGHARSLLNAAAQLSKGRVDDVTLARLNPELLFSAQRLENARREPESFIAYGMELWLRLFQVRPRVTYNPLRKRFEARISGSPPLPGALALQIMLTLTRSTGIAVCSSCGKLFPPSRRLNPNRNAYCKKCGIKAAWREAQARHRARRSANRKAQGS